MLKYYKRLGKGNGFTLIELLVVIAIIAMLIAILVPGMRRVKMAAKKIEQKSMFRNIEIGLALFLDEFDNYPDSKVVTDTDASSKRVCGAQHLAETMLGRDEHGFDPKSRWHENGEPDDIYASDNTTPEGKTSLARRQEPYIELRKTGAFLLDQIYSVADLAAVSGMITGEQPFGTGGTKRAPIIADVFGHSISVSGSDIRRAGTPIVYFKADTNSRMYAKVPKAGARTTNWTYDWADNADIFDLPPLKQSTKYPDHLYKGTDGILKFYENITNPNVSYDKPYNSTSFILISAGWDGVFGTKDDVTNFD